MNLEINLDQLEIVGSDIMFEDENLGHIYWNKHFVDLKSFLRIFGDSHTETIKDFLLKKGIKETEKYNFIEIFEIYVKKEFRGQGIFKKTLELIQEPKSIIFAILGATHQKDDIDSNSRKQIYKKTGFKLLELTAVYAFKIIK